MCKFEDSKCKATLKEDGYCTDTRMLQPCGLYSLDQCPKQDLVDNMGNVIRNSAHCKIKDNRCINKNSEFEESFDNCQYNYLNKGECNNTYCKEMSLFTHEDADQTITKCVPRERLPCSALGKENCIEPIVGEKCGWQDETGFCQFTETEKNFNELIGDITNIDNPAYKAIDDITDDLESINFLTNQNKKYFIRDNNSISGNINSLDKNTLGQQYINSDSDRISMVTLGDKIKIRNDNGILYESIIVTNVDPLQKIIFIENTDPNAVSKILKDDLGTNPVWELENPNIGLYESIQHLQAIDDSINIKNHFSNFL